MNRFLYVGGGTRDSLINLGAVKLFTVVHEMIDGKMRWAVRVIFEIDICINLIQEDEAAAKQVIQTIRNELESIRTWEARRDAQ